MAAESGLSTASTAATHLPGHLTQRLTRYVTGANGGAVEVRSPADDAVIGSVPTHTTDDLAVLAARARAAQREWAAWPLRRRRAVVQRFSALVLRDASLAMDVIQDENGKSRVDALEETLDVGVYAGRAARLAPAALRTRRHRGAYPVLTETVEVRHPLGVVGIISPWNYPFTLAASDAVPALLAGNAVLLKPDLGTPYSALLTLALLREAGLPDGVLQIAIGDGPVVGDGLIDHVDYVMFTGSTATGRHVAQRCASRLIGCSAELGGKNPLVVLPDADIAAAASGAAHASFSNAGQLCISMERIYVHEAVAQTFTDAFVAATRALRVGVGASWDLDVGSLASAAQLERVQAHVADAVACGARVLAGGHALPEAGPFVFAPTVLTDVPETARLAREETFGPVVSVYIVGSEAEAIERANDTDYGLNASLWTRRRSARDMARQLEAGTVNINEGFAAAWGSHGAPMGGWKSSGLGRRHGVAGIAKYTESQSISRQRGLPVAPWPGLPRAVYARTVLAAGRVLARWG